MNSGNLPLKQEDVRIDKSWILIFLELPSECYLECACENKYLAEKLATNPRKRTPIKSVPVWRSEVGGGYWPSHNRRTSVRISTGLTWTEKISRGSRPRGRVHREAWPNRSGSLVALFKFSFHWFCYICNRWQQWKPAPPNTSHMALFQRKAELSGSQVLQTSLGHLPIRSRG